MKYPLMSDTRKFGWWQWASAIGLCLGLCVSPEAAGQVLPVPTKSSPAKTEQPSDSSESAKAETAKDKPSTAYELVRSFSLAKLIHWLRESGPSVVIVLVVMTGILWLANLLHG